MYDGSVNKQSGILVINLPTVACAYYTVGHGDEEKKYLYPQTTNWTTCTLAEYEGRYPFMPARALNNIAGGKAKMSVANWDHVIGNISYLRYLIEVTFRDRAACVYDLSQPMRRQNS